MVLLLGMGVMVIVLSPNSFHLESVFAALPVLNAFRWPFRGLPAAHLLVVALFFYVAARASQPSHFARLLMFIVAIGGTLAVYGYDLSVVEGSTVGSWFRGAPLLDDPEEWSPASLKRTRAGYVANVCSSQALIHAKPRLYFYGNMAPQFGVKTVHAYRVPPSAAYDPLGMSLKGCFQSWAGVRELIERGPKAPLPEQRWEDPRRGPRSFDEIVRKTYVSAVIVDPRKGAAVRYFSSSPGWQLLEARKAALLYARR